MTLADKIASALKEAMKNRDQFRITALRFVMAVIKNQQIAKKTVLTDSEVENLLQKEVKKRKEASAIFQSANRDDLAQKETAEVKIIEEFLPELMSEEAVTDIISRFKAQGQWPDNFGQAMKLMIGEVKGRASGEAIARAVKAAL